LCPLLYLVVQRRISLVKNQEMSHCWNCKCSFATVFVYKSCRLPRQSN